MDNNYQENKRGKKRKSVKEFFTIRQLSTSESMAISFYVFLSLLSGARGVTLIQMTQEEVNRSEMYVSLTHYMSIEVWGGLLLVAATVLLLSALLPKEPEYIVSIISNLILAVLFFLLSAAAYENGSSILNLYNHTIILTAHVSLAGLGVLGLCRKRKNM